MCENFNLNEFSVIKVITDLYANEAKCNHSADVHTEKSIAMRDQIKSEKTNEI